jgi:ureidoglycolate hydrolase
MGPRNALRIKRLVKESSSISEIDRWSGETDNGAPVINFVAGSHKMFTWFPSLEHITIILERHPPSTQAQKNSNGKLGLIDCTSSDEPDGWMLYAWMARRHQEIINNYQIAWLDHVRRVEKTGIPFPEDRSLTVDFKELVVVE